MTDGVKYFKFLVLMHVPVYTTKPVCPARTKTTQPNSKAHSHMNIYIYMMSVWSLQSDGFVSIGNVSSYGCAAFRCSEFVCVPARAHSLHLSPFVSV